MTFLRTIGVAFGALAFAAAIAPASLIDASLAAWTQQRIRLADATGFWWRGRGIIASADGTQRIPIDWRLDGAALARGKIAVQLGRGDDAAPIAGMLSLRSDAFDVTSVRIRLPAALVGWFDPRLTAVTLGGTIDAVAPSLSAAGDVVTGNVHATWAPARVVAGDAVFDLGTVALKSTAAGNSWSAAVENTGGNVAVAGTIVAGAGTTSGTFDLRPNASASAALRDVIARLGVPNETGGVRIKWQNPR